MGAQCSATGVPRKSLKEPFLKGAHFLGTDSASVCFPAVSAAWVPHGVRVQPRGLAPGPHLSHAGSGPPRTEPCFWLQFLRKPAPSATCLLPNRFQTASQILWKLPSVLRKSLELGVTATRRAVVLVWAAWLRPREGEVRLHVRAEPVTSVMRMGLGRCPRCLASPVPEMLLVLSGVQKVGRPLLSFWPCHPLQVTLSGLSPGRTRQRTLDQTRPSLRVSDPSHLTTYSPAWSDCRFS